MLLPFRGLRSLLSDLLKSPPLIPHTTAGFFPIKRDNNICLSCHLPEAAKTSGATVISPTHFLQVRENPHLENGVYSMQNEDQVNTTELDKLNTLFFNCNQCHVPQS